jgi:hypothetical protein
MAQIAWSFVSYLRKAQAVTPCRKLSIIPYLRAQFHDTPH